MTCLYSITLSCLRCDPPNLAACHLVGCLGTAPAAARVPRFSLAAVYIKDIESLLEDVLWNYELVNPEAMRAALDSNRFY